MDAVMEARVRRTSGTDDVSLRIALLCIAAVLACSLVLIATNSSLVADGSYYLLRAIQTRGPFPLAGRQGINLVREGPLLIAVRQGVTNTHVLTVLEGIGFVLFPALVWVLAIVRARRSRVTFTLVVISCGLSFAAPIFFSASELTLALPLVVCASLLLTQPTPWTAPDAVLAVVSTGLLFFSYEAIAPCALILAGTAAFRIKCRLGTTDTTAGILVLGLSVVVFGGAVWTLVFWPSSDSRSFVDLSPSIVFLSLGAMCLLGWAVLYGRLVGMQWIRWLILVLAVPFTFQGIRLAINDGPHAAFESRAAAATVIVALQLLLLADWLTLRPELVNWLIRNQLIVQREGTDEVSLAVRLSAGATRGAAAFLIALLIVPTVCAFRWSTVMSDFRSSITQHTGVVPAADVQTPFASTYLWGWTNTVMSLMVRSSSRNAIVENTTTDFVPFSLDSTEQQVSPVYRWNS